MMNLPSILSLGLLLCVSTLSESSAFTGSSASATNSCSLSNNALPVPKSAPRTSMAASPERDDNTKTEQKEESDNFLTAKARIAQAISLGAPAYNAGDIDECAQLYRDAAKEILTMNALPKPLQMSLRETFDDQAKRTTNGSMETAWAFRNQFDTILEYQAPFQPTSKAGFTVVPFTEPMLPAEPLPIHDNVMGGRSQGSWNDQTFRGTTSLANNGGFASLRWRLPSVQNWSYAQGIYLRVAHSQPDQHTFRLILKDELCEQVRGANYKTVFSNPNSHDDNDDGVIFIPFSAFDQMEQMGRQLQAPPLNRGAVTELGLMAIKPTVVGDFELKILEWGLYV